MNVYYVLLHLFQTNRADMHQRSPKSGYPICFSKKAMASSYIEF